MLKYYTINYNVVYLFFFHGNKTTKLNSFGKYIIFDVKILKSNKKNMYFVIETNFILMMLCVINQKKTYIGCIKIYKNIYYR